MKVAEKKPSLTFAGQPEPGLFRLLGRIWNFEYDPTVKTSNKLYGTFSPSDILIQLRTELENAINLRRQMFRLPEQSMERTQQEEAIKASHRTICALLRGLQEKLSEEQWDSFLDYVRESGPPLAPQI